MRLRTRILLGYGYLVVLLVVAAAGSALAFHQLGTEIGRVLEENFRSVRASMRMLEALERQDSAVLAALLGKDAGAALDRSENEFLDALRDAGDNITLPEERTIVDETGRLFRAYARARDELLAAPHDRPLVAYEQETFPLFEQVKAEVVELLDVNHQAMVEADRSAQAQAGVRAMVLAMLVALALLSLGFLSSALNRHLLDRLGDLRAAARSIAAGDVHRRAEAGRRDELGVVARALNAVLDGQQEATATMQGRLNHLRQLVLGLLERLEQPAALLSPSLATVATTLSRQATSALEAAVEAATSAREPLSEIESTCLEGVCFQPLHTADGRHAGWLAIPQDANPPEAEAPSSPDRQNGRARRPADES